MRAGRLLSALWLICWAFTASPEPLLGQSNGRALHNGWQFRQVDQGPWLPASVPGTVHTDLVANKRIEEPFYRDNEKALRWIEQEAWEFRTEIKLSPGERSARHKVLSFNGLDTYADIYLNGELLLQADNMFRSWEVDVSDRLKGQNDSLRIVFHSPVRQAMKLAASRGYKLPADSDAGEQPLSVYVRKAGYHFGWDWAPRMVTAGIWKPVVLQTWNDLRLVELHVETQEISERSAEMNAVFEYEADSATAFGLEVWVDGVLRKMGTLETRKGRRQYSIPFEILEPELWWPAGEGKQKLYHVTLKVLLPDGAVVAEQKQRVGIRTVRLVQENEATGRSFHFVVNGRPLFMKGANYIPPDPFLPRSSERKRRLLADARAVNMNMLRIWGGGAYEDESFYDACDSLGILVWQDLMFGGGMYPLDDRAFLENVSAEVEEQAKRLRKHPCIALYCGNNEIEVAWKNWGWQAKYGIGAADSAKLWQGYVAFFQQQVPDLIRRHHPEANYISTSPLSNWGHPDRYRSGNMHDWSVWHGGDPIDSLKYRSPRFASEYGFQSYPSMATLQSVAAPGDLEWGSGWTTHRQKSYKGNQPILDEITRIYGAPADFEAFIWRSQLVQAKALEYAIAAHRLNRPHCMGTLYWQLNDCWQGPSWSTIDYDGRWKAGHYALKRLFAPVLVDVDVRNDKILVRATSDLSSSQDFELKLSLKTMEGKVVKQVRMPKSIDSHTAALLLQMESASFLRKLKPNSMFLHIELLQHEKLVAEDLHYFVQPKDLSLPERKFEYALYLEDGKPHYSIQPHVLMKDVRLEVEGQDARFSDNFLDMIPGRTYEIEISGVEGTSLEELLQRLRLK